MLNILLLEDDLALAMHYRDVLEKRGWAVYHEVAVGPAKVTLESVPIDLAICDLLIRNVTGDPTPEGGLSLISHIKLNVRPQPKVAVISGGNSQLNLLQHAECFNVNAVLEKPVSEEELVETVEQMMASDVDK